MKNRLSRSTCHEVFCKNYKLKLMSPKLQAAVNQTQRRSTIFGLLKTDLDAYYEGCEHRTLLELKDALFRSYKLAELFKSGFKLTPTELNLFHQVQREFK